MSDDQPDITVTLWTTFDPMTAHWLLISLMESRAEEAVNALLNPDVMPGPDYDRTGLLMMSRTCCIAKAELN